MPWDDIAVAAFAALAGWAIGFTQSLVTEKKKKIEGVAERYIAQIHSDGFNGSPASRMYAMQIAGVASLSGKEEVIKFFRMVTERGCTYPLLNLDWDKMITEENLTIVLRDANALGHRLVSDEAIIDFFHYVMFDSEQAKAQEAAKNSHAPRIV